ncbi:hypothetical protein NW752_003345 [Fusarium irregulare]|nr:hypothetical protein NW752_003345 [Fusarium irregulare]
MSGIILRDVHYSELPEVARVMSRAFWKDELFGDLIHPHREQYPEDVDLYWLRRARVVFWDYRWRLIVAVSKDLSGKESIVGIAQWERLGDGGKKLECSTLDPRNLLKPLTSLAMAVHARLYPNRAADPEQEDAVERAYPCFDSIWSGKRAESWYLAALAIRPDFHGKGVGRRLVQWGMEKAQEEKICASLAAVDGTEEFYNKCGFTEQFGSAKAGEGNPLRDVPGALMFWYWPRT